MAEANETVPTTARPFVLGRNVLVSLGFTGGLLLLSLASSIVVARLGGPEARGLYSLAQSLFATVGPIASIGLSFSTTYYLGAGRRADELVGLNFAVAGGLLVLGTSVCVVMLGTSGGLPQSPMGLAVLTAAAGLWTAVFNEHARGYFLGTQRVVAYNLVQMASLGLFVLFALVLLPMDRNGVLGALLLSHFSVTLVLLVVQLRAIGRLRWPETGLRNSSLGYGIRASAASLGDFLLLRLDTLMLAFLVELPALGLYAIADQLASVMSTGSAVIGRMMFAQSALDPSGAASRRKLGILIRLLVPAAILVTIIGLGTFWWLIPVFFGDAFAPSYAAFVLLAPSIVVRAASGQFSMYLTGQNQQRPVIVAGLWAVASEGALLLILVMALGWRGAAIAKTIAYVIQFIGVYRAYRHLEPPEERIRWILTRGDVQFLVQWVRSRWDR